MKFYWYFFSVCILFSFSSYAQFTSGGISAQGGLSYISYHTNKLPNISTSNKAMLSFQTGVFAAYRLTKKSGLEAELNYLLQQGQFQNYSSDIWVGAAIGEVTEVVTTKTTYLTLPIRYTYTIRNFTFMSGIQTGIALKSNSSGKGVAYVADTTYYWNMEESSFDNVKTVDFGISLGGQQNIADHLFVALTIFHSLFNILPEGSNIISRRNTNVHAGIGYRLFTSKSKAKSR